MNNKTTDNRQQVRIIDKLLHCGLPFALFRAPQHEPTLYLQWDAEVKCLHHDDTDLQGFIYAPFEETQETPTILIRPDLLAHGWGDMETRLAGITASAPMCLDTLTRPRAEQEDASYKTRFHLCLEAIHRGEFNKLVTAKCQCAKGTDHLHDHEATVFLQALEAYPGNMVHLVYTPLTGLWIGASPELFLSQREGIWQTMALAGTQAKGEGTWSAKNIEEQDYVARFIHDLLVSLEATMESESTPHTLTTGQLEHRCTDFRFRLPSPSASILRLARALHPTPAVGGFPQKEAYEWLVQHEHLKRNYFSGYLGPISPQGGSMLFVNLRCAQVTSLATYYYAGGGLTKDSVLADEVREIERKMDTLKKLNR